MATYPNDLGKILTGSASVPVCGNGGTLLYADYSSKGYVFYADIDWSGADTEHYSYYYIGRSFEVWKRQTGPEDVTKSNAFVFNRTIAAGGVFEYRYYEWHGVYARCGRRVSGSGSSAVYSQEPQPVKIEIREYPEVWQDGQLANRIIKSFSVRPKLEPGRTEADRNDVGFRVEFALSGDIKRIYTF